MSSECVKVVIVNKMSSKKVKDCPDNKNVIFILLMMGITCPSIDKRRSTLRDELTTGGVDNKRSGQLVELTTGGGSRQGLE